MNTGRAPAERADMQQALDPVADALIEAARRRADVVVAGAVEDARVELAGARAEAERMVAQARTEGAAAADWMAVLQLAAARREAHETILGARRRAYETLRHRAVDALSLRASTAEGHRLAQRLSALVDERLGAGAGMPRTGTGPLQVEARSGNRRVAIGPAALVDHVLSSMTEEVEGLWA